MAFTTDCPYNYDVFTVKQLGEHIVKIAYVRAIRESGWELESDEQRKAPCEVVNTDKLANNLCRAKTTVRELVLCNPWDYWCTFTISPDKYERKDLKTYFSDFAEFLHNYNRRCTETEKVRYLLVPENTRTSAGTCTALSVEYVKKTSIPTDTAISHGGSTRTSLDLSACPLSTIWSVLPVTFLNT